MRHEQLLHVLRAAADISGEKSFVLVGSQAVLLALEHPSAALLVSAEIYLYPALNPEESDLIDGAIGALSQFHDTYGYHADGVNPETATMPGDWMARSSSHYFGEITAICPEIDDLAISKCVAGRDKDAVFNTELFRHKMIELNTLLERIHALDTQHPREHIAQWATRRHPEAITL